MVEARKKVLGSSNLVEARRLVSNLKITELEDFWKIDSEANSQTVSLLVDKKKFQFYPAKSKDSYTVEPADQNRDSAAKVVTDLFLQAGLEQSKLQSKKQSAWWVNCWRAIRDPHHLVVLGLILVLYLDWLFGMPSILRDATVSFIMAAPIWNLLRNKSRFVIVTAITSSALVMFYIVNQTNSESAFKTSIIVLSLVSFIEILHHFILPKFPWLFKVLLLFSTSIFLAFSLKNLSFVTSLTILSLVLLSLVPALYGNRHLRNVLMLAGFGIYSISAVAIAANMLTESSPTIVLFRLAFVVAYALLMFLFGYRESPVRLFISMAFLTI